MNGAESGVDMLTQLDELQADENRDFLLMSRPCTSIYRNISFGRTLVRTRYADSQFVDI